jgi:hypothetical protein
MGSKSVARRGWRHELAHAAAAGKTALWRPQAEEKILHYVQETVPYGEGHWAERFRDVDITTGIQIAASAVQLWLAI